MAKERYDRACSYARDRSVQQAEATDKIRLKICSSPEGAGSSPAVRTNKITRLGPIAVKMHGRKRGPRSFVPIQSLDGSENCRAAGRGQR